jgi:drug/metabolite transporter (DMT)-like permease
MKSTFCFIFTPIFFTVIGEFLLKVGVDGRDISLTLSGLQSILSSIEILGGVGLILVGASLWIIGMSKFQLSFMYPFLSLNYVIIICGSEWILGEAVKFNRYLSILFIIIGLVIVSKSPNIKIKE